MALNESMFAPIDTLDVEMEVSAAQSRAAESAGTVNGFADNFTSEMGAVLSGQKGLVSISADSTPVSVTSAPSPEVASATSLTVEQVSEESRQALEAAFADRKTNVVSKVTQNGAGALGSKKMDKGVLGQAHIGGGGDVNQDELGGMTSAADALKMKQAALHEKGHMDTVTTITAPPIVDGQVATWFDTYELFAEIRGNEGAGMSISEYRVGQPENYKNAQDMGITMVTVAGRGLVEEVFTSTGDMGAIQERLDAAGRGRTEEQQAEAGEEGPVLLPFTGGSSDEPTTPTPVAPAFEPPRRRAG